MSENNLILNDISPKKLSNCNFSFKGYNTMNQLNNSLNQNNNILNKTISEKEKTNLSLNRSKSCLFLKKINLKEKKNNYYTKALEKLFYNPINYLNNKYEEKEVIIGKKREKNIGIKELYESFNNQNKKKSITNKSDLKSSSIIQKSLTKSRSNMFNKQQQSFLDETSNKTFIPSNIRETKKYPLSDNELKLIYKELIGREEKNKNKIKKINSPKISFNKTYLIGINNMLNLQEKILKIKNKRNKMYQKISDKIINSTLKDKDEILMNQKKDLLIIKGKTLDKELIKYNSNMASFTDIMKSWINTFRKNQKEEDNKILTPSELIYYNKDNSFQNRSNQNNIRKLFLKNNIINKNRKNKNINKNNNIDKSSFIGDLPSFHNLFIQGKNLLKQEIKISKELYGKKKKIYRYYFAPNEVSNIILAKSYSVEKNYSPKAVINSMEVHKLS